MYLVDSLFKTRKYRNAMIVNGEFNIMNGATGGLLNVHNFALENVEQLEHALPTYTIGEAATATLLLPDDPDNFNFTFRSRPDYADLCTIPETGFEGFCEPTYHLGRLGTGRFSAVGTKLHEYLDQELPEVLKAANPGDVDIVLTHTSSKTEWARFGEKCGIGSRIYHTYDRIGNVVSASIPATMALARAEGRLQKGDRILSCMGSAGMSFNVTTFSF
jgi:3-oxoacyl-[acyl-carrier-protein] synthase III